MFARMLGVLIALAIAATAAAQTTAFTYQGLLKNAGQPAAGPHDMRFRLFDAATGGAQVGATLCRENVPVAAGLFTAQLDFGQQFATPSPRFLEIHVRADIGQPCTDEFGYVVLSPRQAITPSPAALHASSAYSLAAADGSPAAAVSVDNDGNVGIGTTAPTARLDVRGGSVLFQNSGDQADLLWLASERSWVFRQEGIGATAALKLESVGGGGNKNFLVKTDGFMGIGTTDPQAKLDVRGDIRLGTSGEHLAAAGTESLRIVRGAVSATGTATAGAAFSVSRTGHGQYRITFSPPFIGPPSITAMAEFENGGSAFTYHSLSGSGVSIRVYEGDDTLVDNAFTFIAVGPR